MVKFGSFYDVFIVAFLFFWVWLEQGRGEINNYGINESLCRY